MDLIFDTGSDMTMVEAELCWNCEGRGNSTGEVWNTTRDLLTNQTDAGDPEDRVYGDVLLKGFNWQDKVCISLT